MMESPMVARYRALLARLLDGNITNEELSEVARLWHAINQGEHR